MMSFFSRKADTVALAAGALLTILIVAAYVLGIGAIATDLDRTLDPDTAALQAPEYNLDAAAHLNLKGLTPAR